MAASGMHDSECEETQKIIWKIRTATKWKESEVWRIFLILILIEEIAGLNDIDKVVCMILSSSCRSYQQ